MKQKLDWGLKPLMSAIAGVYHFHRRRLDKEALTLLGRSLDQSGPDGIQQIITRSVGIIYRPFHTNAESRRAQQPLCSLLGQILTWDGRLDNRADLLPQVRELLPGELTDAHLVMGAYARWGDDFLAHIVGDYAIALWDNTQSKLLLARDPFASRQLFYHINDERLVWATELKALLRLDTVSDELSEDYIASYLTKGIEPASTPYKEIKAVPPGHIVTVRNGELRLERFWRLDPHREIRYAADAEYEEHFRELFREAVRCRLQVEGPVCAELSGGLDSSSIVGMADEILQANEAEASSLTTISYVFDESRTSDERTYIHLVEHRRGKHGFHLREEDYPILSPLPEDSFHSLPTPELCFAARNNQVWRTMQQVGARVLLRGTAGDDVLWGDEVEVPFEIADLALEARPLQLLKSMRLWSDALRVPYLQLFWRALVLPLMPRRIRARISLPLSCKLPPWFNRDFEVRQNLRERMLGPAGDSEFRLPSTREQLGRIQNQLTTVSNGFYLERGFIEVSNPFLHLPLVEFCVAVPLQQTLRPGETRSLLRRSLRHLLPDKIASRRTKAGPDEAIHRALAREWPRLSEMFADARVCAYGYIEPSALQQALNSARFGVNINNPGLLRILSLELWLRGLEHWRAGRRAQVSNPRLSESPRIVEFTEAIY